MHVNPGRVHNVSHALNSSLPVTNNNEGSINLKPPPTCQETVKDYIHALTKVMMDANIKLTAVLKKYTAELNYIRKESREVISKLTERLKMWINLNKKKMKYDKSQRRTSNRYLRQIKDLQQRRTVVKERVQKIFQMKKEPPSSSPSTSTPKSPFKSPPTSLVNQSPFKLPSKSPPMTPFKLPFKSPSKPSTKSPGCDKLRVPNPSHCPCHHPNHHPEHRLRHHPSRPQYQLLRHPKPLSKLPSKSP